MGIKTNSMYFVVVCVFGDTNYIAKNVLELVMQTWLNSNALRSFFLYLFLLSTSLPQYIQLLCLS